MSARTESRPAPRKHHTTVERTSDREVVVTRIINGPARMVFETFTKASGDIGLGGTGTVVDCISRGSV